MRLGRGASPLVVLTYRAVDDVRVRDALRVGEGCDALDGRGSQCIVALLPPPVGLGDYHAFSFFCVVTGARLG